MPRDASAAIAADNAQLEIIADNTQQVLAEMPRAIARALERMGILAEGHVVGYITENYIVDTGRLRNSITHAVEPGGKAVAVGTNVEYAPYVHNGTTRTKPRPFLVEPVTRNVSEYRDVLKEELGGS